MIEITPATTSLLAETTQQFASSLAGVASVQVTWSISEGADGGSIDSSGLYTAPMAGGIFHVVASPVGVEATPGMATVEVDRPPPGSLDTSFADGGVLIFDPLTGGNCPVLPCAASILILDGGIIAVAGTEKGATGGFHTVVVELDSSGVPVPGFQVTAGSPISVHSFAMQGVGKFLLAGVWSYSGEIGAVERRGADGTIDQTFGDGGLIYSAVSTLLNTTPMLVLPDSGFLIGDDLVDGTGANYLAVADFSADGELEQTTAFSSHQPDLEQFAEQLLFLPDMGGAGVVLAIAMQTGGPDDEVVAATVSGIDIAGEVEDSQALSLEDGAPFVSAVSADQFSAVAVGVPAFITRFEFDAGRFDTAFEANTTAALAEFDAGSIWGVALDPQSRPVMAATSTDSSSQDSILLIRFDDRGNLDSSFGARGILAIPLGSPAVAEALALQADGKILVAGQVGLHWVIARCWP